MTIREQGAYECKAKGLINSGGKGNRKGVIERTTNKLCPGERIGFSTQSRKRGQF